MIAGIRRRLAHTITLAASNGNGREVSTQAEFDLFSGLRAIDSE